MAALNEGIIEEMQNNAPLHLEKATAIAEKHGVKTRSVIATAVRRGIEYQKKQKVSKNGGKTETKESIVKEINENIPTEVVQGLCKASKDSLRWLRDNC